MADFLKIQDTSLSRTKSDILIDNATDRYTLERYELFAKLLEYYQEFLNQNGNPMDVMTRVADDTSLISADDDSLDNLIEVLAPYFPKNIVGDNRLFFRIINDFYQAKGSVESIKAFFKILFDSDCEIYLPDEDVFRLSDNNWDEDIRVPLYDGNTLLGYTYGAYTDNNSFLSDKKVITDCIYYQPYSYVLRVETNIENWKYIYNRICHPAGLVYFGEISIIINLEYEDMMYQPGDVGIEERITNVVVELNDLDIIATVYAVPIVELELDQRLQNYLTIEDMYFRNNDIAEYLNLDIDELMIDNDKQVGTYVVILPTDEYLQTLIEE